MCHLRWEKALERDGVSIRLSVFLKKIPFAIITAMDRINFEHSDITIVDILFLHYITQYF